MRHRLPRLRRFDVAVIVGALVLALFLAGISWAVDTMGDRIRAQSVRLDQQDDDSNTLYDQLKQHGVKPAVTPTPVPTVAGPIGPAGEQGLRGPQGERGPRGPSGPAGEPGKPGKPGPTGSPGPMGDTGMPGADGEPGDTGSPGPQGTVGPRGETGSPGPQGEKGSKGDTGAQGPAGKDGKDGERGPAGYPASWTWTDPLGRTQRCTDDDGDHEYSCALVEPTPTGGP